MTSSYVNDMMLKAMALQAANRQNLVKKEKAETLLRRIVKS
jgi:hypothetical protein